MTFIMSYLEKKTKAITISRTKVVTPKNSKFTLFKDYIVKYGLLECIQKSNV